MTEPVQLGTLVPNFGVVQAIHGRAGERFYFLTKNGAVSLIDEATVRSALDTATANEALNGLRAPVRFAPGDRP